MRGKVPNHLGTLLMGNRDPGAVQRHLARQRRAAAQAQASPDQDCEPDRAALIEDAARDVVISWMCGEPIEQGIEELRRALGIECSPV